MPLWLRSNYRSSSRNRRRNLRNSFGGGVCSRSAMRCSENSARAHGNEHPNQRVGRDYSGTGRCVFVLVQIERAQLRTAPPVLCRACKIEKRRLDIRNRSSQPALCHCMRGIDRDGPRIGWYWAFPLPPINRLIGPLPPRRHCKGRESSRGHHVSFSKSIEFV
jgi:hypothetical protein